MHRSSATILPAFNTDNLHTNSSLILRPSLPCPAPAVKTAMFRHPSAIEAAFTFSLLASITYVSASMPPSTKWCTERTPAGARNGFFFPLRGGKVTASRMMQRSQAPPELIQ